MKDAGTTGPQRNERFLLTLRTKRQENFRKNLPFLILSDKLPEGQVYREYPDGRIEVQEVFSVGPNYRSRLIQILQAEAANKLRQEYGLL